MARRSLPRIAAATLLLLLLCLAAGRPQVFSDTRAYYALGEEAVRIATPGTHPAPSTLALRGRALPAAAARGQVRLAYTVAASRSPYWSALFFLAARAGTAWLVAVLQAAVAAAVLWLAARGLGVERAYLPVAALLALGSSLPVEAMFLMPDLFAGLAILAALVLAFPRAPLRRWERTLLWATMAAGALFHTSHLLTLALLGLGTFAASRGRPARRRAAAAMLGAAALGTAGALAYPLAVRAVRHEPIYAPPFLSARLIADGPGRALLAADCRARPDAWGWCPYLGRPLVDVNAILWSRAPGIASFQAADYDRRVRIIREQPRFVAATATRFPGAVAGEIGSNVGHLLFQYGTNETLADPTALLRDPAFAVLAAIVPGGRACAAGTASCAPRVDVPLLDAWIGAVLLASLAAIAAMLAGEERRRGWAGPALFLLGGLFANALVCGGISGNAQRYQSRVTWLVPMLAAAMLADRAGRRRPAPAPARERA